MSNTDNKMEIDADSVKSCWQKIKSAKGTDFFVEHFINIYLSATG